MLLAAGRQCGFQIGQEHRLIVSETFPKVREYFPDRLQAQSRIFRRQADRSKAFGLFVGELEPFFCPFAQMALLREPEQRMPNVVEDLLLVFSLAQSVQAAQVGEPLIPKSINQPSTRWATAYIGRAGIIEPIRLSRPLFPLTGKRRFPGEFFCNVFEVEIGLAFPQKKRANSLHLFTGERMEIRFARSGHTDVADKSKHPELLEQGMRSRTTVFRLFKSALAYQPFLRFQGTLVENGAFQVFFPLLGQMLLPTNGFQFCQTVFVARSVLLADGLLLLVEAVEILAQVTATALFHLLVQFLDTALDFSFLALLLGVLSVADKTAALHQMIERAAKCVAIRLFPQIQCLVQRPIPIVVRIFVQGIIRTLPLQETGIEGIDLLPTPFVELFVA